MSDVKYSVSSLDAAAVKRIPDYGLSRVFMALRVL